MVRIGNSYNNRINKISCMQANENALSIVTEALAENGCFVRKHNNSHSRFYLRFPQLLGAWRVPLRGL